MTIIERSPTSLPAHPHARSPSIIARQQLVHYRMVFDNGLTTKFIDEYQYTSKFTIHITW